MNISIVIPTLNEVKNIETVVMGALAFSDEVIVVDGGSTDGTREIAKNLNVKLVETKQKGKGSALKIGVNIASNEIIVFMDADCSHDPKDIPKLIDPIVSRDIDHVFGSRVTGGSDELSGNIDQCLRLIGSTIITLCINLRFNTSYSDSQNGYRAIKKSVFKSLSLKETKTTIEQEMMIKTLAKGLSLEEIPSHEYARTNGVSKISLYRDSFRYLFSLFYYLTESFFRNKHIK